MLRRVPSLVRRMLEGTLSRVFLELLFCGEYPISEVVGVLMLLLLMLEMAEGLQCR